jgi:hypothetical protein
VAIGRRLFGVLAAAFSAGLVPVLGAGIAQAAPGRPAMGQNACAFAAPAAGPRSGAGVYNIQVRQMAGVNPSGAFRGSVFIDLTGKGTA